MKDGRQLEFRPLRSSLLQRRTGEMIIAILALLMFALLFLSALPQDGKRARYTPPRHPEETRLR